MVSTKIKLSIIAALALVVIAGSMTTEAFSRSSKTGAVIGGLIAGAAIGAAISSSNHPSTIYVDEGPRRAWNGGFSPKPGITCYAAQQACYKVGGGYSGTWTYRIYGR